MSATRPDPSFNELSSSDITQPVGGTPSRSALIVVDVQNDFTEGGSLAVSGGAALALRITRHITDVQYDLVAATRDWHTDPGDHFAAVPDFVDSWPPHCVAGSSGAGFHPDFDVKLAGKVFSKGAFSAAYSGFEGVDADGLPLLEWLRSHHISDVSVVGIATDYCVRATVLGAVAYGFNVTLFTDLVVGVAAETSAAACTEMAAAGVTLCESDSLTRLSELSSPVVAFDHQAHT